MNEAATAKKTFPVFARHHGVWEGTYTLIDAKTGQILDQHRSKLTCLTNGIDQYAQRNEYFWDDGRTETKAFPGKFEDGRLKFDTPRLTGEAYEVDANTICLFWVYTHSPNDKYSEIITLDSDTHRCRTWQHLENGVFAKLTIIDEYKIS